MIMNKLSIISQNLNGAYTDETIGEYKQKEKADIYAFQELKRGNCNITDTQASNMQLDDFSHAKEIWEDAFPWIEFKSGYWKESSIKFSEQEIRIINFHSSPWYSAQIRYTLLKRLNEIKKETKFVILLGDFNAEFRGEKDQQLKGAKKQNDAFLTRIMHFGFTELLSEGEVKEHPHGTFEFKKDGKTYKKRLDHIFISKALLDLSGDGWKFSIQYIDDVNIHLSQTKLIDHSGIRLTIQTGQ